MMNTGIGNHLGKDMIMNKKDYDLIWNVYLKHQKEFIEKHKNMPLPKYTYSDEVEFDFNGPVIGYICIVDKYGTFEQNEEPSYDIYVVENNTLYKHIRESYVKRLIAHHEDGYVDRLMNERVKDEQH